MKTYGVCRYISYPSLDGGECAASRPGRFTPWERAPAPHLIEGWEDLE